MELNISGLKLNFIDQLPINTFWIINKIKLKEQFWPNFPKMRLLQVGGNRCALSYRRCETTVEKMLEMINVELEQIEGIQKEVDAGVISVGDIQNR